MIDTTDWSESTMFLFLRGPRGEPREMRLYVQGIEDFWTAMMVDEDEPAPPPASLQGVCFFGKTPEEAKTAALSFYGRVDSRIEWLALRFREVLKVAVLMLYVLG